MKLRTTLAAALGAVGVAAAAAYAPLAHADRVGFNVTIGGPGYAFNIGNSGYGYYAPPPVVVAPYVPYYRSYYAPPVVVRPYPVYRPYYWDRHDRWDRHDHRNRHDRDHWRDRGRGHYHDR